MLKLTKIAALIALGAATLSAPAFAGDRAQVMVATADLDLTSEHDRARLQLRIKNAARSICRVDGPASRQAQRAEQNCVQQIIESTQPQVRYAVAKANGLRDQVADAPIMIGTKG